MARALVIAVVLVVALATATNATAAIFIRLTTTTVQRGGILHLVGNADRMPLYALPAARIPCARYGTCPAAPIHRAAPPKRPFVFLGYTPVALNEAMPTRAFSIRLPRALRPGRYKVFVWCEMCGGSHHRRKRLVGADASHPRLRSPRRGQLPEARTLGGTFPNTGPCEGGPRSRCAKLAE